MLSIHGGYKNQIVDLSAITGMAVDVARGE